MPEPTPNPTIQTSKALPAQTKAGQPGAPAKSPPNPAPKPTQAQDQPKTQPQTNLPPPKNKSINLIRLSGFFTLVIIVLITSSIFYTSGQSTKLSLLRQQIADTQLNNLSLQDTLSYLQTGQDQIELISRALPNNDTLVDFVNQLEAIASEAAANPSLEFSAISPAGQTGAKYIPLIVKFDTNLENLENFLSRSEKLPYIFEVTSIQAIRSDPASSSWQFTIAARIYVQEPFEPITKNKTP